MSVPMRRISATSRIGMPLMRSCTMTVVRV